MKYYFFSFSVVVLLTASSCDKPSTKEPVGETGILTEIPAGMIPTNAEVPTGAPPGTPSHLPGTMLPGGEDGCRWFPPTDPENSALVVVQEDGHLVLGGGVEKGTSSVPCQTRVFAQIPDLGRAKIKWDMTARGRGVLSVAVVASDGARTELGPMSIDQEFSTSGTLRLRKGEHRVEIELDEQANPHDHVMFSVIMKVR